MTAGRPVEARDTLVYDEELYSEHADPYARTRLAWTEGRLAAATASLDEAERSFLSVHDYSVERGQRFDRALVSLDLAELYRRQRRWLDVRSRAAEAAHLFEGLGILGEARRARNLIAEASRH